MNPRLGILISLSVACLRGGSLFAQDPEVPTPPPSLQNMGAPPLQEAAQNPGQPAPAPAEPVPGADSTVSGSRTRDPFWPVGYAPKVIRKATVGKTGLPSGPVAVAVLPEPARIPQWDEAMRKLDIRGISLIGRDKASGKPKYLAMVAGKLVEEGNVVSVNHDDFVYRWKVVGISTAGVSLNKLDVRKE